MGQIPDYQEKAKIEQAPVGSVSRGVGEWGPEEAMQRAGAAMANIGDQWGKAIQDAQTVVAVSKGVANASVALNDKANQILSSPEFLLDPPSVKTTWQQDSEKIRSDIMNQIPAGRAQDHFLERFYGLQASQANVISDAIRKQQVSLIKDAGGDAVQKNIQSAIAAPNDTVAAQNLANALAAGAGMVRGGAWPVEKHSEVQREITNQVLVGRATQLLTKNPVELVQQLDDPNSIYNGFGRNIQDLEYRGLDETKKTKLRDDAIARNRQLNSEWRAEKNDAERDRITADNTRASDQLTLKYGLDKPTGNFDAALQDASSPQTAASMGLATEAQREHLQNWVHAQRGRMEQGVKAEQTKQNNDLLDGALSGKYTPTQILTSNADPQKKKEALEILAKRKTDADKTDPAVWKQVMDLVDAKKITAWNQISPLILHGLSTTDGYRFKELVEKGDDMDTSGYTKLAHETFQNRYVDNQGNLTADAVAVYPGFCMELDAAVKKDNLRGSAIMKRAKEIMDGLDDVVTDGFWGKSKAKPTANWERLKNWSQLDNAPLRPAQSVQPTSPQAPGSGAASTGGTPTVPAGEKTPVQQQAAEQSDFRNWISEQLRQARYPATDANIKALSEKWRKRDPGIEKNFKTYTTRKGAQQ